MRLLRVKVFRKNLQCPVEFIAQALQTSLLLLRCYRIDTVIFASYVFNMLTRILCVFVVIHVCINHVSYPYGPPGCGQFHARSPRGLFPDDDFLAKLFYLALQIISLKRLCDSGLEGRLYRFRIQF